jgi:hypothetical protein
MRSTTPTSRSPAVFATHAAVAMDSARREANLERKADIRDLIGRAKGIVMLLEHVTDDKAFHMLRDARGRAAVPTVQTQGRPADHVSVVGRARGPGGLVSARSLR